MSPAPLCVEPDCFHVLVAHFYHGYPQEFCEDCRVEGNPNYNHEYTSLLPDRDYPIVE